MKILMVTSEAVPFAKTGGLADAVSSLSIALSEEGHEVSIVLPLYSKIDRSSLSLFRPSLWVNLGKSEIYVNIYKSSLPDSKVTVYFIEYQKCFGRNGIYGDTNATSYGDNPFRFTVFSRSVLSLCQAINYKPDIIHAHDWAGCLANIFIKLSRRENFSFFKDCKTVLTIHNMGYQGKFPWNAFGLMGLEEKDKYSTGLCDVGGGINFLKGGISSSDFITTVSPTYANEILYPEGGFGLDGLMRVRKDNLKGILNGCDLKLWNPSVDETIPCKYSYDNLKGKAICKEALQKKFGLKVDPNVPVISMVSRLVNQKGIDEVFKPFYGCMYKILTELKVQVIVVGSGEAWCEGEIHGYTSRYPNMGSYIGYNEPLSHLVEAGSDIFLMPSKYEPCGLNQIYSLMYGTVPVVHHTGGLADTIEQVNEATGEGNGFKFYDLNPSSVFETVKYAVRLYDNKNLWASIMKNGMTSDFSWIRSADEYIKVYQELINQ